MVMQQPNENKGPWWKAGVRMFSDISTWIIVPIIGALTLGKYLDRRFDTEPTLLLILSGLSFLITAYGILKTVRAYTKNLKNNGDQTNTN